MKVVKWGDRGLFDLKLINLNRANLNKRGPKMIKEDPEEDQKGPQTKNVQLILNVKT